MSMVARWAKLVIQSKIEWKRITWLIHAVYRWFICFKFRSRFPQRPNSFLLDVWERGHFLSWLRHCGWFFVKDDRTIKLFPKKWQWLKFEVLESHTSFHQLNKIQSEGPLLYTELTGLQRIFVIFFYKPFASWHGMKVTPAFRRSFSMKQALTLLRSLGSR